MPTKNFIPGEKVIFWRVPISVADPKPNFGTVQAHRITGNIEDVIVEDNWGNRKKCSPYSVKTLNEVKEYEWRMMAKEFSKKLEIATKIIYEIMKQWCMLEDTDEQGRPIFNHDHVSSQEDAMEFLIKEGIIAPEQDMYENKYQKDNANKA